MSEIRKNRQPESVFYQLERAAATSIATAPFVDFPEIAFMISDGENAPFGHRSAYPETLTRCGVNTVFPFLLFPAYRCLLGYSLHSDLEFREDTVLRIGIDPRGISRLAHGFDLTGRGDRGNIYISAFKSDLAVCLEQDGHL